MKQVTDLSAIEKAIDAVIAANPDKVEEVKAKPAAPWFVGQVMKSTGGKANPKAVNVAPEVEARPLNGVVTRRFCRTRTLRLHRESDLAR